MLQISKLIQNKKGSAMVESAIVLPLAIFITVLLVRVFAFYMEILDTGVVQHREALMKNDAYTGKIVHKSHESEIISIAGGSLLGFDLSKKIESNMYLINEDFLVRSHEAFD